MSHRFSTLAFPGYASDGPLPASVERLAVLVSAACAAVGFSISLGVWLASRSWPLALAAGGLTAAFSLNVHRVSEPYPAPALSEAQAADWAPHRILPLVLWLVIGVVSSQPVVLLVSLPLNWDTVISRRVETAERLVAQERSLGATEGARDRNSVATLSLTDEGARQATEGLFFVGLHLTRAWQSTGLAVSVTAAWSAFILLPTYFLRVLPPEGLRERRRLTYRRLRQQVEQTYMDTSALCATHLRTYSTFDDGKVTRYADPPFNTSPTAMRPSFASGTDIVALISAQVK